MIVSNTENKVQVRSHQKPAEFSAPRNGSNLAVAHRNSNVLELRRDASSLSPRASALSHNEQLRSQLSEILEARFPSGESLPTSSANSEFKKAQPDDSLLDGGFDRNKLNDPNHKTVKYTFARVAMNYKLDSVKDMASAETLLKAMSGDLKAAGIEVVGVSKDRIQVKTEVGYEWVDVIKNAGAGNPEFWWGSEGVGTAQPTKTPQEWAAQTAPAQASASAPPAGGAAAAAPSGPKVLGAQIDMGKVMSIVKKYPPTNEGIRQALPELQETFPGVKILDHPQLLDKLHFPNGAIVDVIVGAGGANPSWGWMPEN